ncbi:MAG: hypothetical protein ACQESN_03225 [Thermotogota bacterium]
MKKNYLFVMIILIISLITLSVEITPRSPSNNSDNVDIRNIFRWNISEDSDFNYNLYLSTEKEIEENDLIISNLFSNFYAGNILKPDTNYYWQIEAIKDDQNYKSDIFHFKTRPLKDGDIFEIIYGDYEQIEFYNDYYLGIKINSIDVLDKTKEVINSFSLKSEMKKISYYEDKGLILDTEGNLYILKEKDLTEIKTEQNFIDIQNNILLSNDGLYYFENEEIKDFIKNKNISKIKAIKEELFVIYEEKVERYSKSLSLLNETAEESVLDIFSFEKGYLILKNEKIISLDKELKKENEVKFNVNFEKLNRKIQTSNGYIYILSGKDILSIYNEKLERIKSINLDFKTNYIISDKENFILIGESIKAQNINGDTFWSYGTLNEMEIFSAPIIKEDSFLIGVSDYLKRHLFFYNDFSEDIGGEFIKTNAFFKKTVKEEKQEEDLEVEEPEEEIEEQEKEQDQTTAQSTPTKAATELSPEEEITFESTINNIDFSDFPTITSTPEDLLEDEFTLPSTSIEDEMDFTLDSTETQIDIITEKSTITETPTMTEDSTITDIATITDMSTHTEELTSLSTESTISLEDIDFEFYYEYVDYIDEMYKNLKNGVSDLFKEEKIVEQTKIIEKNEDIYVYDINIDKSATETAIYLSGYKDNGDWNNLIFKLDENLEITKEKIFGGNKTDFIKKSLITKDASNNSVLISVGDTSSEGLNGDVSLISLDKDLKENYSMNYGDIGRDSGIYIDDYDGENYIIMGNLYVNNKLTDMFLAKYSNDGSRLWTSNFGGKSIEISKEFSVDNQENILALGSTRSFGYGGFDIYLIKMDFYGNEIWSNTFGTETNDLPVGIKSISNNRFLVVYQAEREGSFENRVMVINSEGNIIRQFSSESEGYEKFLGIKEYKNQYYIYGFKREEEKTKGIIYTINLENGEIKKTFEIIRDVNFEIQAIDFHEDIIYIAGNEDDEKNKIIIIKKELKGDK